MDSFRPIVAFVIAVLAALAFAVAGCGSSNNKSEASSDPVSWANGFCSAVTSYRDDLQQVRSDLGNDLSKNGLNDAVDGAKSATDDFRSTVHDLGRPNTQASDQAEKVLSDLSTALEADAEAIKTATDGASVVEAVAVVSSTFVSLQDQLSSALTQLRALDTKGEIERAFAQAPACAPLTST